MASSGPSSTSSSAASWARTATPGESLPIRLRPPWPAGPGLNSPLLLCRVEVRDTPMRMEVVIRATQTANVLGEKGRRIRELTSAVQKRCALQAAAPAWELCPCTVWSLGGRAWAARLLSPCVHGEVCRAGCERSLTVARVFVADCGDGQLCRRHCPLPQAAARLRDRPLRRDRGHPGARHQLPRELLAVGDLPRV